MEYKELKKQLAKKIGKAIDKMIAKEEKKGIWLTNEAIIDMIPVSATTFYNALKGKCSLDSLIKICDKLGIDIS